MDVKALFKGAGRTVAENSPAILTALAVTGTITTAVLAAKGAFKASKILDEKSSETTPVGSTDIFKEKVTLTWECYIPATVSAAFTVAAIVSVNRVGERRAAAMASAYGVVQSSYQKYMDATAEKIGNTKETQIRETLAQDQIDNTEFYRDPRHIMGAGPTVCFEPWSGRYFGSDAESIRAAVNDLNFQIINENYASMTDLWNLFSSDELPATMESDDIGWNTDQKLEVDTVYGTHNGNPCLVLTYKTIPIRKYNTLYR